jgi:predicted transcriptional regulator
MKLLDLSRYGPMHRFADFHIYKALAALSDGKRKGRKQLADSIGVGEGSMRTILEYLRDHEMIEIKQTGVLISEKGLEFLRSFSIQVGLVTRSDVSIGQTTVAVQVRGKSDRIKIGVEQRDAAVRVGAEGATTIVVRDGDLWIMPDYDLDENQPEFASELRGIFDIQEGDAIIIGTGQTYGLAEDGALAAAFDLI